MSARIPTFAIIGHPNEGKSSVLSTLAEDDRVRISPVPGETTELQAFPVIIDRQEVIRFIDTPGFQNPRQTLAWLQAYQGPPEQMLGAFIASHRNSPEFRDDCLLLTPVAEGAGVIFVVDGSRPVRNVDRMEMEILRLSGAPRMAVINSKGDDSPYLAHWQSDFRQHFNAIRTFNSCRATYAERIELLESLKSIDQQLEPVLRTVIATFQADWHSRNQRTAELIVALLTSVLDYRTTAAVDDRIGEEELKEKLLQEYMAYVGTMEKRTRQSIRALYKHNIFDLDLPRHSILKADLFSHRTWEFLGLTDKQLVVAGALGGATLGAGLDLAAGGVSFGVFSAIGGLIGAAGTLLKGKALIDRFNLLGLKFGAEQVQVGPASNIQLLFILLDRSLLFYSHIINWAHGRRDYERALLLDQQDGAKEGFTSRWSSEQRSVCSQFFQALQKQDHAAIQRHAARLHEILMLQLRQIARDDRAAEVPHPPRRIT